MSEERDKDIPAFGLEVQDTRLRQKLEAMREAIQKLMGTRGVGGGRAAVRWDDLKEGGLVSQAARRIDLAGAVNEAIGSGAVDVGNDAEPDLTKPPTPTGLAAVAGLGNVLVEWGAPIYTAGRGHKQTNVYATKQPAADNTAYTINDAVRVDSAVGPLTVIALPSDLGVKWRIWIRFESNDGVESDPAGGVNGVVVTTGRIGNADLGDLIVQAGNLAAGAVTAAKFGTGIEPVTIATGPSLPTVKSTNALYWNNKLYRWNGTAYVATVPTTDLSGQVADAQIAGLAASKVTGQLSDSQIASVAAAKLTGQIVGTQITDGAISTAKLSAGSVTTAVLAVDAVTADKIAANAVTASEIAAGAVTTAKLAAGAVTANEIAAGAITTAKLAAGAVTASEIAADAVTAGKIQAGAITANKLAANAIAVGTAAVENGAINNAMIGNAAIDDAKIANLSAAKLTAGDGTIGGNLKSSTYSADLQQGWIVRPDGFAEFNDIVVRGTVFASAGAIGGSLIGANYIQSTNWINLTTGWRLNNDGTFQLNAEGWINTAAIGDAQITAAKIADAAITSAKIADAQITTAKIQDAAVGTLQIAEESIFLSIYSFVPRQDVYDATCRTADYEVQIASATIGGLSGPGTAIVFFNTRSAVTDARTTSYCDSSGSANYDSFDSDEIISYALSTFGPEKFLYLDVRVNGVTRFTIASPYNGQTTVNSARFTRFACSVPLVAGTNNVTVHLRMSQSTYAQRMRIMYFVPPSDMIVFSGKR